MTEVIATYEARLTPLQKDFRDFVEAKLVHDDVDAAWFHDAQIRTQQYRLRSGVAYAAPFDGIALRDFQDGRESFVAIDLLRGEEELMSIAVHNAQWEIKGKDQNSLGSGNPEPLAENLFGIVQALEETGALVPSA